MHNLGFHPLSKSAYHPINSVVYGKKLAWDVQTTQNVSYISSKSNGLGLLTFIFHFFHVIFLKQKYFPIGLGFLQGSALYLRENVSKCDWFAKMSRSKFAHYWARVNKITSKKNFFFCFQNFKNVKSLNHLILNCSSLSNVIRANLLHPKPFKSFAVSYFVFRVFLF